MATTKEDLLIAIRADTSKAVQGLESVTVSLGALEQHLKTAYEAQGKMVQSSAHMAQSLDKVSAVLTTMEQHLNHLQASQQKSLEISAQSVAGFDKISGAIGSLDQRLQTAEVSQKKTASSLNDIGAIATKIAAVFYVVTNAVDKMNFAFQKTVGEYYRSEDGLIRLANALAMVGEKNIPSSLESFKEFASVMQETTTIEDDQVIALAALGVAAGRSDAEIRKLIKTAVNLSAITRDSFETSFSKLLVTFKGMTRSLEEVAPELKNLTDQQVTTGAAVDLLAEKFRNAGEGLAGTFSGQVMQAKNALGDLGEQTGKILAKAFAIDQVAVGFNKSVQSMTNFLAENGAAMAATLAGIREAFVNFGKAIGVVFLSVTEGLATIAKYLSGYDVFAKAFGIPQDAPQKIQGFVDKVAAANKSLRDSMTLSQKASEKAFSAYQKEATAAVKASGAGRRPPPTVTTPDGKNLLKELDGKVREMQKNAQLANKTELEQITIRADLQRGELKILEDKIKKERVLTEEAKKKLALGRQAIKEQEAEDKKRLEKSVTAALGGVATSGDTKREAMNQQFADMQKLIDMKREFLFMKGPPPASAVKELEEQQQILEKRRQAATAAVPSNQFENAKATGDVIAGKISGAITGPAMGAITGAMAGAMSVIGAAQGAIDMAQSLLDAVPKLLESFAGLIDTITNLPLRLAEAIGKVFTALINFVRNFLPNIVKMLDSVLEGIVSFVENLPDAFMAMVDDLSTRIVNLIEKLPTLLERLVTGLVVAFPEIIIKLMEFTFSKLPDIMLRTLKFLMIKMAEAFYKGLLSGLLKVRDMFGNLLKGKWPKAMTPPDIKVDGKQAAKTIAQLTKDTNKMFSVNALEDAAKSAGDTVRGITEAAANAGKTMWDYFLVALKDGWGWLMKAGGKIWDGLKRAVGIVATTLGKWGKAIWNGLRDAVGKIAETFGEWGQAIWDAFINAVGNLVDTFGKWGQAIWDAFINAVGNLADTFGKWGTTIWDSFKGAVGNLADIFGKWGTAIWDGFKGALDSVGGVFSDLGKKIWLGLKDGLDSIGNALSKMFQFDGGGKGTVEKFIGMDFPFVAFAKGGLVPGSATVAGDSPLNDKIPAMLSPGEVVLPRSLMADEAFRRVVMAKLAGQEVPHLSRGGVIGKVLGGAAGAIIPDWVRDLYQSLSRYVDGLDLMAFVRNPRNAVENAIKGSLSGFAPDFKRLVKPFAQGGLVQGPGGTDNVPAMLTAGEFVMRRPAVEAIGLPTLAAMNRGQAPGGDVTQHFTFNLKIESKDKVDETFIKQRLMPAIREELRRGSLDGRAVVYAGGVRA